MARTVTGTVTHTKVRDVIWNDGRTGPTGTLQAAFTAAQDGGFQVSGRDSLEDFAGYVHDTESPVITTDLTLSGGPNPQTEVALSWAATDDTGITSQQVWWGTTSPPSNVITISSSATSYIKTGLSSGTLYYFFVRIGDRRNSSTDTSTKSIITTSANNPPFFQTQLSASDGLNPESSIFLQWQSADDNGVTSQTLYWGKTNPPTSTISLGASATQYSKTNLSSDTTYYFYVRACDGGGLCTNSTTVSHTTAPLTIVYTIYLGFNGSSAFNACNAFPGTYYADSQNLSTATKIYSDSGGNTFANAGYYSNQSIVRYWNGFGNLGPTSFC